jgi:hypothetical protein
MGEGSYCACLRTCCGVAAFEGGRGGWVGMMAGRRLADPQRVLSAPLPPAPQAGRLSGQTRGRCRPPWGTPSTPTGSTGIPSGAAQRARLSACMRRRRLMQPLLDQAGPPSPPKSGPQAIALLPGSAAGCPPARAARLSPSHPPPPDPPARPPSACLPARRGLQQRGMEQDLSWEKAAEQYEDVLVQAKYQW